MTRNEFLSKLADELKKNIGEIDDIISEYDQHFAFKLADGFSEEEILLVRKSGINCIPI